MMKEQEFKKWMKSVEPEQPDPEVTASIMESIYRMEQQRARARQHRKHALISGGILFVLLLLSMYSSTRMDRFIAEPGMGSAYFLGGILLLVLYVQFEVLQRILARRLRENT